jgi:hypothetical protein
MVVIQRDVFNRDLLMERFVDGLMDSDGGLGVFSAFFLPLYDARRVRT